MRFHRSGGEVGLRSRTIGIAAIAAALGLSAAAVTPSGPIRWERRQITSRLTDLTGISGVSSNDIFVVGTRGTVLHFDGARWSEQKSGTSRNLTAVWAPSSENVVAVGFDGTILHFDGRRWVGQTSGTTRTLSAIWGDSPSNVFAVGRSGTILRYDGRSWHAERSGTGQDLLAVWGSSGSDVYAGGARGTLLHFDGGSWSRVEVGPEERHRERARHLYWQLNALGGTSPTDVYAAGWRGPVDVDVDRTGVFLHYDGRTWKSVPGAETELVSSLWAVSPTDVFVAGRTLNGLNDVRHYDGKRLSTITSDARFGIRNAVWSAPNGEVFVVGEGGMVLHGVPGPR
jgi:hypothetical protein